MAVRHESEFYEGGRDRFLVRGFLLGGAVNAATTRGDGVDV
ncbi:MAG: hypothetical protein ACI9JD_006343, partial [Rhodococcus sp. (in: high G+C Gram-positive bacteria)]